MIATVPTKESLVAFEERVKDAFLEARIRAPIHLSGGNEDQLLEVFKSVHEGDWVLSTWRSHYHALLHGIDPEWLFEEILAGRSMYLSNKEHRFLSSAIVAGMFPIAVGIAWAIKQRGGTEKVWCFLGDMAFQHGAFHEAYKYAGVRSLPITWVVEDNGLSTNTPTMKVWGFGEYPDNKAWGIRIYTYKREHPHVGAGRYVVFQ